MLPPAARGAAVAVALDGAPIILKINSGHEVEFQAVRITIKARCGMTRGCWIDLFESPKFRGKMRRLSGPANYLDLCGDGADWDIRILSLIAGPKAYVRLFIHLRPDRTLAWLLPNQSIHDLTSHPCRDEFDSIHVLDRQPLSREPGYAAFAKAVETLTDQPARPKRKRRG